MVRFSIIIPHYNIPGYLEKQLESTPYDRDTVEVIVVDDRSDKELDKLLEIKKRFKSLGIRFYRNNRGKKGAGRCRNIGIKHSSGKWLIFADSDDFFPNDFYNTLSLHENSESDIVYFRSLSIDERGNRISGRGNGYNRRISEFKNDKTRRNELLLRYDVPVPWGKMIKKEMVDLYGIRFDETPVSNDVMFSVKCGYFAKEIEVGEEYLYYVREREGSLTTTFDEDKFRLRTDIFVKMCTFLKHSLSKEDWELLGFNGNIRLIEAFQRGYSMGSYLYIIRKLAFNGIKPVSLKGMSFKTAPDTLKRIIYEKRR